MWTSTYLLETPIAEYAADLEREAARGRGAWSRRAAVRRRSWEPAAAGIPVTAAGTKCNAIETWRRRQ
jgi:hypothetical protein